MNRVGSKRETSVFCHALLCFFFLSLLSFLSNTGVHAKSFLILILIDGRQIVVQILTWATAFTQVATEVKELIICDNEL